MVRGSLGSESLPLSNSICLNVKKTKKKSRTFKNPSNLSGISEEIFDRCGVSKLYLLEVGAMRGVLGIKMLLHSCLALSEK